MVIMTVDEDSYIDILIYSIHQFLYIHTYRLIEMRFMIHVATEQVICQTAYRNKSV